MFLFKKNEKEPLLDSVLSQSDIIFTELKKQLNNNNIKIKIELILFYYFLTDLVLSENNYEKSEREKLSDSVYSKIQELFQNYKNDDSFNLNITSFFNNRIISYTGILENNNNEITNDLFKQIYDYQVELISTIILKNKFSNYNPCPKTPMETTPKILNLLLTSNIRGTLVDQHAVNVQFLSEVLKDNVSLKTNNELPNKNPDIDINLFSKYESKIYEIFYDEFQVHNDFIKNEINYFLFFLYNITKGKEFSDEQLLSFTEQKNIKPEIDFNKPKNDISFFRNRINSYHENLKKNKNVINRVFFNQTSENLSNFFSCRYEIAESLLFPKGNEHRLSEKEELRQEELESRSHAATYKSIYCYFDFLREINNTLFISEEEKLISEISQLKELKLYKKIKETPFISLNEILNFYSFQVKDGYFFDSISFYTNLPNHKRLSHLIIDKKIDDNKKNRFDYDKPLKPIELCKYYINNLPCNDEQKILDYLLLQISLEDYMNIRPIGITMSLITDENKISEYKELAINNPIINKSFIDNTYPNIIFYDDFYHIGLFTNETDGIYFKVFKIKSCYNYEIEYSQIIKKREQILLF